MTYFFPVYTLQFCCKGHMLHAKCLSSCDDALLSSTLTNASKMCFLCCDMSYACRRFLIWWYTPQVTGASLSIQNLALADSLVPKAIWSQMGCEVPCIFLFDSGRWVLTPITMVGDQLLSGHAHPSTTMICWYCDTTINHCLVIPSSCRLDPLSTLEAFLMAGLY